MAITADTVLLLKMREDKKRLPDDTLFLEYQQKQELDYLLIYWLRPIIETSNRRNPKK